MAVLTLASLTWCQAQTQSRGAPTPPGDTQSRTNSNPVRTRNSLQQLEDALSKSFQSFSPGNAAESVIPPSYYTPPRPVTAAPRPRERRKELLTMEDLLMPSAPGEDNFKLSGEKDEPAGKRSIWEQYYEEWNRPRSDPKKAGAAKEKNLMNGRKTAGSSLERENQDDSSLPTGIRENEKKLKDLLAEHTGGRTLDMPTSSRSTFADFFGLGEKSTVSPEDQKAHKAYMETYRQMLDANSTPPPNPLNPLNPLGPADPSLRLSPNVGAVSLTGAFGQPAPGTPAAMDALLNPGALPDINARVLNQWNPFYIAPKIEPPKPAPLAVPTVQAPKRTF